MITHEAVAQNGQAGTLSLLTEHLKVCQVIGIRSEHAQAVGASLDHVVRKAGNYDSSGTSHVENAKRPPLARQGEENSVLGSQIIGEG
jgi:hypothetical protein